MNAEEIIDDVFNKIKTGIKENGSDKLNIFLTLSFGEEDKMQQLVAGDYNRTLNMILSCLSDILDIEEMARFMMAIKDIISKRAGIKNDNVDHHDSCETLH
jgi:hypothetical protein